MTPVFTGRGHGWAVNMGVKNDTRVHLHGPWTWASIWTSVFTGRGPRVVCTELQGEDARDRHNCVPTTRLAAWCSG